MGWRLEGGQDWGSLTLRVLLALIEYLTDFRFKFHPAVGLVKKFGIMIEGLPFQVGQIRVAGGVEDRDTGLAYVELGCDLRAAHAAGQHDIAEQ